MAGFLDRMRKAPRRRLLAPAGAVAVAALVVATAAVVVSESGSADLHLTRDPGPGVAKAQKRWRASRPPPNRRRAAMKPASSAAGVGEVGSSGTAYQAAPLVGASKQPDTGPYASQGPAAARSNARPRSSSARTPPRSVPTPPRSSKRSTPPTASS